MREETRKTTERFVEALARLERDDDLDGIVALFADDCTVGNTVTDREFSGAKGAREFWRGYRSLFADITSEYRNQVIGDDAATLEWRTTGSAAEGEAIDYGGVSVLEVRDGEISRFWAYFDPDELPIGP
jgi:ketosteroid isomerase-like protein